MIATALHAALILAGLGLAQAAIEAPAAPDAGIVTTLAPLEQAPEAPEPTLERAGGDLVAAVRGGEWWLAAVALSWLLVKLLRAEKIVGWIPWLRSRAGGYTLAFTTALLVAIGAAGYAGQGFSFGLLAGAVAAAFGASGLHESAKDLKSAPNAKGA